MSETQAGITALISSYARAYHAVHDSPKIFDDYLAEKLFSQPEQAFFEKSIASMLPDVDPELAATHPDQDAALACVMQKMNGPITLSRSRYAEDCLAQAVRKGVSQYVLLGAGMDTFAFRNPEWARGVQVFEVDHPATQALKRQRVMALASEIPAHLHFIPLDFETENLTDALSASAYRPELPGFFCWLGVSYYLTREAVLNTFQKIVRSAGRGSEIVFDYLDPDAFIPDKAGARVNYMQHVVAQTGEPMKTGFAPAGLASNLFSFGLELEENLAPEDIEARYFAGRTDGYHAFEHIHFARVVAR
jgi:methyltransferase (TIGR00027 family)